MNSDLPPLPDAPVQDRFLAHWNRLRSNKTVFFMVMGFVAGFVGDLVTEPFAQRSRDGNFLETLWETGKWVAGIVGVLAPALAYAGAAYSRRPLAAHSAVKMACYGFLGGGISGLLIQFFYSLGFAAGLTPQTFLAELFRCVTWGLMGGMVGALLARTVPNLARWRAVCAGLVGGSVGCVGFLMVCAILPDTFGRLLGIGVMGMAISLSIVVAERLAREASLEVVWAPNEVTFSNLGEQPVTIGGGSEDHIFVRGFPASFAGITFSQGRVEYTESASGRRAALNNGSRLEVGKLALIVHTDVKD